MLAVLGWIVFGLIIGLIARAIMPGAQPMGFMLTALLGVAGSFVGDWIDSRRADSAVWLWNDKPATRIESPGNASTRETRHPPTVIDSPGLTVLRA
jgi:hypothetical protein